MKNFEIKTTDNYIIHGTVYYPEGEIKGLFEIVHGMSEHKERYYPFMEYLASQGYIAVIHELRGHGKDIPKEDFGYFGEKQILVDDVNVVMNYLKEQYPNLDIILFGHSMGSLIARNYIQNYDDKIEKLILSGPPTYNPLIGVAIVFAFLVKQTKGERYRSDFLNKISVGSYDKEYKKPNSWLTTDYAVVEKYNQDELCGFIFTVNGFQSLFYLLENAYHKSAYQVKNLSLPILILGGSDDPVIRGEKKFQHLQQFLTKVGYQNIEVEYYPKMRHELLQEKEKEKVYQKIMTFIENR